jgi:archaeal type IV pilus assembly protein PilA
MKTKIRRTCMKNQDSAVSPVIAVMLMLVVTIIIAAVVSGFAGSLVSNTQKAPSIAMDVTIKNAGTFANSYFEGKILSISEPLNTSNINLVTTWGKNGASTVTKIVPTNSTTNWTWKSGSIINGSPWGYGPGVSDTNAGIPNKVSQRFGNYILNGGTEMYALPAGQAGGYADPTSPASTGYGVSTPYTYTGYQTSDIDTDGMQTVLGKGWEVLRTGDVVNVKLIYTPSGSTILDKNVVVQ